MPYKPNRFEARSKFVSTTPKKGDSFDSVLSKALQKGHQLGELFGVRLRPDDAKEVREAISRSGESQPDWLRRALITAARKQ